MKQIKPLLILTLLLPLAASAENSCRSAAAAAQGAQSGYERDRAAAEANEQRESASSDTIGRCLSGVTSIVVVPAFPSLGDIFSNALDKMCHVASRKVRESTKLPNPTIPGVPTTTIPQPVGAPAPTNRAFPQSSFWNQTWR